MKPLLQEIMMNRKKHFESLEFMKFNDFVFVLHGKYNSKEFYQVTVTSLIPTQNDIQAQFYDEVLESSKENIFNNYYDSSSDWEEIQELPDGWVSNTVFARLLTIIKSININQGIYENQCNINTTNMATLKTQGMVINNELTNNPDSLLSKAVKAKGTSSVITNNRTFTLYYLVYVNSSDWLDPSGPTDVEEKDE